MKSAITFCINCGKKLKTQNMTYFEGKFNLNVHYCPKCKMDYTNIDFLELYQGKAQRSIDKRTGIFRMKVSYPENIERDLLIKTVPRILITQPRQKRKRGKETYYTKEKTSTISLS